MFTDYMVVHIVSVPLTAFLLSDFLQQM